MKTVWIDSAPLIASPQPTTTLRECELMHHSGDGRMYLAPMNPRSSPLYVSNVWLREPTAIIDINECPDGRWSYFPRAAAGLLALHGGQFDTEDQAREAARADKTIPRGAAFPTMRRQPELVFHSDPGHGWLETTFAELKRFSLEDKVSSYSYIDRTVSHEPDEAKVYLEEDCDAPLLLKALTDHYGREPKIRHRDHKVTGIRNLPAYAKPDPR